jgi:hypothetical protein
MIREITEGEFAKLLSTIRRSAFRLETLEAYAVEDEQADFELFLAGRPGPPPWQDWLEQVSTQTRQGKTVARVRILAEPPTDYQRWMLWAQPWYAKAGEDMRYMSRSQATAIHLPLEVDWWLLDDEQLVLMYFTGTGEIAGKALITEPAILARHREWRDLAVRHATAAEEVAVA